MCVKLKGNDLTGLFRADISVSPSANTDAVILHLFQRWQRLLQCKNKNDVLPGILLQTDLCAHKHIP